MDFLEGLELNEGLEWTLDIDIVHEIVGRFYKYISFRPDPNAMAVDAFSISWTKQYIFVLHLSAPSVWFYRSLWKTRRNH